MKLWQAEVLREHILAASRPPVPVLRAISVTGSKQFVQERTLAIQMKRHFELMTLEGVAVLKEGKGKSWALGLRIAGIRPAGQAGWNLGKQIRLLSFLSLKDPSVCVLFQLCRTHQK